MEHLTTKVYLPSKGKFNALHAEPIELDMIGFEEEKIAFGADNEEALDEVLQRCVKSPENFDVALLTPQDRRFLLIKLRIHSYGDEYHVMVPTKDGMENVKISLDHMPVIELLDDFEIPHGKLPLDGREVKIKVLNVSEIRKVENYCREKADKLKINYNNLRHETLEAKSIAAVDGQKLSTEETINFLKSLKGKDLAYIRYLREQVRFGYENIVEIEIEGRRRKVPVPMTGEFFRYNFADTSRVKSRPRKVQSNSDESSEQVPQPDED